ncbi:tyrosine-type recombinase/integrase [Rahnella sp. PAMC 25559]|uniref:tyrosine-type recombinase/integrase n=1 Tax=Rahnella sp. PAMC 25559 TaxID=3423225 RepID=UPI003D667C32
MKRQYLTRHEIEKIIAATVSGRHGIRDSCLILMSYIHGFRVSELTGLKMSDLDIESKTVYIQRLKNGHNSIHPIHDVELDLIIEWIKHRNQYLKCKNEKWLFLSQCGTRLTRQRIYSMIRNYSLTAGIQIFAHPHMLRHSCGYELANQGMDTRLIQDYLGHRNIRHTVHYTSGNSARFSRVWQNSWLASFADNRIFAKSVLEAAIVSAQTSTFCNT